MYLIDRFLQLLRGEVVLHFINTWDIKYPLSRNFLVTSVKFAFAIKIKAKYERPHVQLCKSKSRNSLNLTFYLNTLYLTSILFTWLKTRQWKSALTLGMCHGCVYTGSSELDYPRTLLVLHSHVHRIEIPCRAFPERVGPRVLSLESVDYFGATDHFRGRKKKNNLNEQNCKVYWKIRIEDPGIRDQGSVKKNLKINK